jgi:hypothetical protein
MKARILYPLTILLVVILSFPTLAQPGDKREDIESMKIAFLTRRLNLTPEEAKKFWPVYNQFSEELKSVRETRNKAGRDVKDNFQQMTDKEIEKVVDSEISYRQQELDILKKYNAQFKQTLPMRKVALLYRAEDDFKKELLERIKERREQKMGGPRPR